MSVYLLPTSVHGEFDLLLVCRFWLWSQIPLCGSLSIMIEECSGKNLPVPNPRSHELLFWENSATAGHHHQWLRECNLVIIGQHLIRHLEFRPDLVSSRRDKRGARRGGGSCFYRFERGNSSCNTIPLGPAAWRLLNPSDHSAAARRGSCF